jgi:hypothetical protein
LGAGLLLDAVTAGNHSHTEHYAGFAVGLATLAYFTIAIAAERRASERSGAKLSSAEVPSGVRVRAVHAQVASALIGGLMIRWS